MSKAPILSEAPEPVVLIIADISGYTRYMTANAKTLAHSQTIITELMHAIIHEIQLPLEVAKLEGDAVFLYCRKGDAQSWEDFKRVIGGKLLTFFRLFRDKVGELSQSVTCSCNACAHIDKLRLKIVAHSGQALFHRVYNFVELAGVDVIIVHRLLKNSISADQYLLLTETARNDLEFPEPIPLTRSAETYGDIGSLSTLVYVPDGERDRVHPSETVSFSKRFERSFKLFCKLWFAPFASRSSLFHNLSSDATAVGRILFAVLTALLTPIVLPVGTIFAFFHAFTLSAKSHHGSDCHERKPDGSCCQQKANDK
jgi:hypothetical protein